MSREENNIKVNFILNGIELAYNYENHTILQALNYYYIDIPHFCFHERLSIAGNCRMCLVEVQGSKKLLPACSISLTNNMNIKTQTLRVKHLREAVLEFLLINHPLDCPVCDQGGHCDLQDLSALFGSDRGRFYELTKRAVSNKNFGSFIKTVMNRCIHCTRCIRFTDEVIGSQDLGILGRGFDSEVVINNFFDVQKKNNLDFVNNNIFSKFLVNSNLSGNLIDLCPVGALTQKPNRFSVRS